MFENVDTPHLAVLLVNSNLLPSNNQYAIVAIMLYHVFLVN